MITKQLIFDETAILADNDNVGAFLRAEDGTLLTHTTVGPVEALDVYIANPSIVVTATDLDIRDLSHTQDSVKIGDGVDFLAINADGSINVSSADNHAEDSPHTSGDIGSFSLAVRHDANTSMVSADGDYAPLQVDATGRLKVDAIFDPTFDFVYAEDSAHASGDLGAFTLAVRNDARATFTSADGDYSPFAVDAAGRILTTAEKAEDSAHTSGDYGNFVLGVRNDTNAVLTSADLDYTPLSTDSSGRLKVVGTFTSGVQYAEDSPHTSGDMGDFVLSVRQDTLVSSVSADGDYAAFKVTSRGGLWTTPVGTVADAVADTENPVKVGSRAVTGALTAVTNNQRADLLSDNFRRIWVNSSANVGIANTAVSATTTATAVPTTPLTGRRVILIQNLENKKVYLGGAGVTTANGLEISSKGSWEGEVGDDVALFIITAAGSADIRVQELA